MLVVHTERIDDNHSIEIGFSSWDPEEISVRNRFNSPDGRFDPHSSSEIPIADIPALVRVVIERLPDVAGRRPAIAS
jgi:hypothetical protein